MTRSGCIALLLALTLAGCGSTPSAPAADPTITLGQDFQVSAGHTATLPDGNVRVVFNGVSEDSRCPTGLDCAWAGKAVVQISVYPGSGAGVGYNLILGGAKQGDDTANSGLYVIRARALDPLPSSNSAAIPTGEYVVTLLLTKK